MNDWNSPEAREGLKKHFRESAERERKEQDRKLSQRQEVWDEVYALLIDEPDYREVRVSLGTLRRVLKLIREQLPVSLPPREQPHEHR